MTDKVESIEKMNETNSNSTSSTSTNQVSTPVEEQEAKKLKLSSIEEEQDDETKTYNLNIKWKSKKFQVQLSDTIEKSGWSTIGDLKEELFMCTGVIASRQKLLNLKIKGKMASDDVYLNDLKIKPNMTIMLMGTEESQLEALKHQAEEFQSSLPEIIDDFVEEKLILQPQENAIFLKKLANRVKNYKIEMFEEPRKDKKLLVLDIDYTLFDHRSPAEKPLELMRPYLHEFLTEAYRYYDIVIWSATGMRWIKLKMKELGVESNPNYKICFYLCHRAMITCKTQKYGVFNCKPLAVIWERMPWWSAKNTIMFDDLGRNFIMNPTAGLKIRPFRDAAINRDTDKELYKLTKYLKLIQLEEDFETLNHKKWEYYVRERKEILKKMKQDGN